MAEKVNIKARYNWTIKYFLLLKGKKIFKIIIELKQNNICPEPLQLKVTFIPEFLYRISCPFSTDSKPVAFNNNQVKNADKGEKIIDKGIKFFIKNFKKYDSMRSVSEFNQPPQKLFMIKGNRLKGFFDKIYSGEYHSYPRQKFSKSYSFIT